MDKQTRTLTITSNITFYGSSASLALATQTANDIQTKWNAAGGKVSIGGTEYNVLFSVTGEYKPGLTPAEVAKNTDIKQNFVRVEETAAGNISSYDFAGNSGYFLLSNIQGAGTTTEAHEYGHGLGLVPGTEGYHPEDLDLRGEGQPGIMYPRGTLVDAPYTYSPAKGASTVDPNTGRGVNTLSPEKRKVTQSDINMLGLDKLKFDNTGKANLGRITNTYKQKKP
ncbi:MAG: peptidase M10 [Bacteroidetes bacterium]|nr:peptidase M10 [Bacteroidota bacterium]